MNGWTQAWFWILLIGLILVIIGAIIRGVNCEMSWWSGGFFLVGFILVLIGIALALWNWASMANTMENKQKVYVSPSPTYHQYSQYSPHSHYQVSPGCPEDVTNRFKYANHPQVIHSPHVTPSPISSPTVSVQRVVTLPQIPRTVVSVPSVASVVSVPSATSVPLSSPSSLSLSNSPIVPTPVTTNIPQAQRGFSTSGQDLSALSPV